MRAVRRLAVVVAASAVLGAGPVRAQGAGECASVECGPRAAGSAQGTAQPGVAQAWQQAAALHELKLQFIAAIQRTTLAQAGLFGDERPELEAALGAMRAALTAWDAGIARLLAETSRLRVTAEVHVVRGTVLLDRHRLADALRDLDEAARMDAERVDVPALQALALTALGRTDAARRALGRVAAGAPDNPVPVYGQALRAIDARQSAEARRQLVRVAQLLAPRMNAAAAPPQGAFERVGLIRQAPGVAPIFPLARYVDAYAALASNDFARAVAAFERAVQDDPLGRSAEPVRLAVVDAVAALRRGQVGEARRLIDTAAGEAPSDAEVQRVRARILWADDASEQALDGVTTALRLLNGDERARLLQADLLEALGKTDEALQALQLAVSFEPKSGTGHYRIALLRQLDGRLAEARTALDECARLQPIVGQDHVHFLRGSLAANQADLDAAVEAYLRRVDVNPNNTEAHRQLAEVYFLQGRDDEALAEHSVAVFLAPRNGRAHAGRGQVLLRMGRHAEAVAALRQAVSLGDDRPETRYGLGMALTRDGHADEGHAEIDASQGLRAKAMAIGRAEFELAALRRAAATEQAAGRYQDAVGLFERALALDTASARSRQDLGAALLAAGRPEPAAVHLRQALQAEPTVEGAEALAAALAALGDEAGRQTVLALRAQLVERLKQDRLRALTGGR